MKPNINIPVIPELLSLKKLPELEYYKETKVFSKRQILKEKTILPQNITDRIKTFEDACAELNIKVKDIYCPSIGYNKNKPSKHSKFALAALKLSIIVEALNEGWEPNWKHVSESKYYPRFIWLENEFILNSINRGYFGMGTAAGITTNLCFKTEKLAEYAGKQFIDIYNDFLFLNN